MNPKVGCFSLISAIWSSLKILKADLHVWADSDLDIVKSKKSLIMLKQLIQLIDKTLDILIDQKKWTIKNYIDYKKFIEGN